MNFFESASETRTKPKKMTIEQRRINDDLNEYIFGTPASEGEKFDPEYYIRSNPEVAAGLGINIDRPLTAKDLKRVEKYHNQYKDFDPLYYAQQNPEVLAELGLTTADLSGEGSKKAANKLKQHFKTVGQYEGLKGNDYETYDKNANSIASYEDRYAADYGAIQNADQAYLDTVTGANNNYANTLQQLVDQQKQFATTPIKISGVGFTGSPLVGMTKSGRNSLNYVTDQLGTLNQIAAQNAALQKSFDTTYTPYGLQNEWMGVLQGQDDENYNRRMREGKTRTTNSSGTLGNITSGVSALSDIANAGMTATGSENVAAFLKMLGIG